MEISKDFVMMCVGIFGLIVASLSFAFIVIWVIEVLMRKGSINDERQMRRYKENFGIIKRSIWEKVMERMSQL